MLLAAPIALPFLVAILCHALRERPRALAAASVGGAFGLLAVAVAIALRVAEGGPFAEQMSAWPAPYGITLAADALSAGMLVATAVVGLAASVFALSEIGEASRRIGHHTLTHMLLAGVSGAFVTGDLFNLYVWFEVLLIASFGLLVVGGTRRQLDGAMRYVALNLLATVAFLTGVGLLYGATGALNMADLRRATALLDDDARTLTTAALLLFAFGAKAALFPLFFWLPASYHTPSFTVSAVFAALLTKVGVYSMLRVFTLIYGLDTPWLSEALFWGGAATMLTGALGALAQIELRRVLAFQVIASIGLVVAGLGLGTQAAIAAAIFYLLQDMAVKMNLFGAAWLGARLAGSEDMRLGGGVWGRAPWVATLFLLPALALAGVPPFSGFWAKVLLLGAALDARSWTLAVLVLVTGLLTLWSMGRVWAELFWKPQPESSPSLAVARATPAAALAACLGLTALIVAVGLQPAALIAVADAAAAQLLDPGAYVAAVLGGSAP